MEGQLLPSFRDLAILELSACKDEVLLVRPDTAPCYINNQRWGYGKNLPSLSWIMAFMLSMVSEDSSSRVRVLMKICMMKYRGWRKRVLALVMKGGTINGLPD